MSDIYTLIEKKFGKNYLNKTQKCIEYSYTFNQFIKIYNMIEFKTPPYQVDIDMDKINEMIISYKKNPEYFLFKNKIVCAIIQDNDTINNIYLMDGQHRVEMVKKFNEEYYNSNMILCFYLINSDLECRNLFDEINKDSFKSYKYIMLDDFSRCLQDDFIIYLNTYYSIYFEKKRKKENIRRTISELMNELENYFIKFDNIDELINDFQEANKKFNNIIGYLDKYNNNPKMFYKDECDSVKNGYIFTLKTNNFIKYILDNNIKPKHIYKNKKKRITAKLKSEVWEKYCGDKKSNYCFYKDCSYIIKHDDYSCGHIISEYNGGETTINNLKPMCANCNYKLGKRNWV